MVVESWVLSPVLGPLARTPRLSQGWPTREIKRAPSAEVAGSHDEQHHMADLWSHWESPRPFFPSISRDLHPHSFGRQKVDGTIPFMRVHEMIEL